MLNSHNIVRTSEKQPNSVREEYNLIQRDPYKYLLTNTEKFFAYGTIPRALLGYGIGSLWMVYFLRRYNQLDRLRKFRISGDMVVSAYSRFLLGLLIGDRFAAWFFCDYKAIWCNKAASYEVRKIMKTWPDTKPFVPFHKAPNSYFWL